MSVNARPVLMVIVAATSLAGASSMARRAAPPDLGEMTLDRADPTVAATIAGVPTTLAVLPDVGVTIAPGRAALLPVEWRRGDPLDVGRVAVPVREAEVTVSIAGVTSGMRLLTLDRPCCRAHDGSIGAADLPWSVVRIGRAGTLPERRFPAATASRDGLSIPWVVGRDTIHVILAPDNPETIATAAAAAILARVYGGHLGAAVRDVPVIYGIARPMRDMAFDAPVPLLGFTLRQVAVRVSDFAGAAGVLDPADPGSRARVDPGAIVVRHRPPPPQYRWAAVTIGRDLLDRCPQIAIHTRTEEIGLSCALP